MTFTRTGSFGHGILCACFGTFVDINITVNTKFVLENEILWIHRWSVMLLPSQCNWLYGIICQIQLFLYNLISKDNMNNMQSLPKSLIVLFSKQCRGRCNQSYSIFYSTFVRVFLWNDKTVLPAKVNNRTQLSWLIGRTLQFVHQQKHPTIVIDCRW